MFKVGLFYFKFDFSFIFYEFHELKDFKCKDFVKHLNKSKSWSAFILKINKPFENFTHYKLSFIQYNQVYL